MRHGMSNFSQVLGNRIIWKLWSTVAPNHDLNAASADPEAKEL